ncbi:MAG: BON domain-containing protein [Acidobacteria bacterium]|nr:BON domain-containing protein [Acidobacteriota bacterium]
MSRRYDRYYDREPVYRRGDEDRERWRDYGRREDERRHWDRAGDEEAERRRIDDMRYGRGSSNIGSEVYGRNYNRDYDREYDRDFNRDYGRQYGRDISQDWGRSREFGRQGQWMEREGRSDLASEDIGLESRSSDWMHGFGMRPRGTMRPMEGPFAGRGPRNYARTDDRIREDIIERLTEHPLIDAYDIEVSVQNGEVTLSGNVDNRQMKRMAEDTAEDVWGVKDVHNSIRVKTWQEREKGQQAA